MIATFDEVLEMLKQPYPLIIAAAKETLEQLPAGNWIGGTVPFFIQGQGNEQDRDHLDVTVIPDSVKKARIKAYSLDDIHLAKHDSYEDGFTLLIIPGESDIHHSYALNSRDYPVKGDSLLVGWVSGHPLSEESGSWTGFGPRKTVFSDRAVAVHCQLKPEYRCRLDSINVFKPGEGPILEFPSSGFKLTKVHVDGQILSFAQYIRDNQIDISYPMVAIGEEDGENVSFKQILDEEVQLYAPVFNFKQYRLAQPEKEFHRNFMEQISRIKNNSDRFFACNCILNYSYADMSGKDIGDLNGPVTFGEIAGNLLNQTYLSLSIESV